MRAALAMIVAALPTVAAAAPPPPGSDDWNIMAPEHGWIERAQTPNGLTCCSDADGRPVEARIGAEHWEAHVTPAHFPGEADRWVQVPENAVIRKPNPLGIPILWLYAGVVRCFAPPVQN
jgi:hypothetical protein